MRYQNLVQGLAPFAATVSGVPLYALERRGRPGDMGTFYSVLIPWLMEASRKYPSTDSLILVSRSSHIDTKYWPSGGEMRYTTAYDAFYIHMLGRPNSTVTITNPIPYMNEDKVAVVGGEKDGTQVARYTLSTPGEVAGADKHVWTFKFEY